MKKLILLALTFLFLFVFPNNTFAQRSLGLGASYSTALQATGIQAKFNTLFSDKLGSTVEFEHFFLKGDNKWQTVSLHFLYNIIHSEDFNFYILGGGQFLIFDSEDLIIASGGTLNILSGRSGTDIGGRLGVGLNKFFNSNLMVFAETKIAFNPQVEDLTTFSNISTKQIIPTVGLAYQF